jgi:hypothetical protein
MPQQNGIVSLPQSEEPGIANRIGSFLRNLGRGREEPQWKIDLREKVARGEADPALLTMGIDPLDKAAMIEGVHGYGHRFSPAQKLWGAGLLTGVGGVADAFGYYPEPPSREASIYEMTTAPSTPSVKEHWQTGHPWIAGLQSVGAVFPGAAYLKAASGPLRRGIASIRGAEPAVEALSDLISPARRQFLKQAGLATAGIAALGAGIGKVASGAKAGAAAAVTKAAAPVARVAAKVGQLTQRANINKFHNWITHMTRYGLEDAPLRVDSGRPRATAALADSGQITRNQIPNEAADWLDEYGLEPGDFNLLDDTDAGDWVRNDQILNSLEDPALDKSGISMIRSTEGVDSFGSGLNNPISLYEESGVPMLVDDYGQRVFVPNEAGLRKLELHQMKQSVGDDFPDWLRAEFDEWDVGDELERIFLDMTPDERLSIPGITGADADIWPALEEFYSIPLAK